MDYEKKYKEALEKAKEFYILCKKCGAKDTIDFLEDSFSELKESEDEKIRKMIINHLMQERGSLSNDEAAEAIAWLEKQGTPARLSEEEQNRFAKGVLTSCALSFINYLDAHKYEGKMCVSNGECEDIENAFHNAMWDKLHRYYCKYIEKQEEQKPVDKVEPKFKVGDWIVYREGIWKIGNIALENYYELLKTNNEVTTRSIKEVDENAHLWTIQDAKDGDVLKEDSCTFIIERMKPDGTAIIHCCLFDDGDFDLGSTLSFDVDSTYPATKEQRDLLFQKMHESGYEWDANNKELNKIYIIDEGKAEIDHYFTKMMNGEKVSSTWSEEDEDCLSTIIAEFSKCAGKSVSKDKWMRCNDFLNSLRDRIQPKQEWSKEDEEMIGCLNNCLDELEEKNRWCYIYVNDKNVKLNKVKNWLKSIRIRIKGE